MEEEIWKPIEGFEGSYEISNIGRVKSLVKMVWNHNGYVLRPERILKPGKNISRKTPYYYVYLTHPKTKRRHSLSLHVLVNKTFNGPKPSEINGDFNINCMHLNGNSLDNRASNLAWGTHRQNMNEETCRQSHINSCPLKKEVVQYTLNGKEIARYKSARDAARETGLNNDSIAKCARKHPHYLTHGGFRWKYAKDIKKH